MAIERLALIVLLALLVLVVTLAVLLVPSISWAAGSVYEWFTHPGSSPCGCVFGRG
jgi:predicted PurR-regulated permease PerM